MTMETLKNRWEKGRISDSMLRIYVRKGVITAEDYEEITGKPYAREG